MTDEIENPTCTALADPTDQKAPAWVRKGDFALVKLPIAMTMQDRDYLELNLGSSVRRIDDGDGGYSVLGILPCDIVKFEPARVQSGDKVRTVGLKTGPVGDVIHVVGERAWVRWNEDGRPTADDICLLSTLTREF